MIDPISNPQLGDDDGNRLRVVRAPGLMSDWLISHLEVMNVLLDHFLRLGFGVGVCDLGTLT